MLMRGCQDRMDTSAVPIYTSGWMTALSLLTVFLRQRVELLHLV